LGINAPESTAMADAQHFIAYCPSLPPFPAQNLDLPSCPSGFPRPFALILSFSSLEISPWRHNFIVIAAPVAG